MKAISNLLAVALIGCCCSLAQSLPRALTPALVGSSYTLTQPFSVAPGQLITLIVDLGVIGGIPRNGIYETIRAPGGAICRILPQQLCFLPRRRVPGSSVAAVAGTSLVAYTGVALAASQNARMEALMNWNRALLLLVLVAVSSASLVGQDRKSPIVMGAGYEYSTPLYLAPGQLVTLFVQGTPFGASARAPDNSDIPTSLAGVSVGMTDLGIPPGFPALKMAILEVRQFRTCSASISPACFTPTGAVTVQVPYELTLNARGRGAATLGVHIDASSDLPFSVDVWVVSDRVRILKSLDSVLPITESGLSGNCASTRANAASAPLNLTGLPCPPLVTHADGSLVTAKNPAKPGEELVAYAVGLGQTSPPLETGRIVTSPARTLVDFTLDFNYRPNALATRPRPIPADGDSTAVPQPLYAGATPGYVGLYQVNFVVPPVPPGTPPCAEIEGAQLPTDNVVYSNLTVSVGGRYSFDGAGICVAVNAAESGGDNSSAADEHR